MEPAVPNVFAEPRPNARPEGTVIEGYVLETPADMPVDGKSAKTQARVIAAAKALGHKALVSLLAAPAAEASSRRRFQDGSR